MPTINRAGKNPEHFCTRCKKRLERKDKGYIKAIRNQAKTRWEYSLRWGRDVPREVCAAMTLESWDLCPECLQKAQKLMRAFASGMKISARKSEEGKET